MSDSESDVERHDEIHDDLDETDGARVDEGDHDAPFDIGELPQQHDVLLALYRCDPPCQKEYIQQFKSVEVKTVSLRKLCDLHNSGNANAAIALLRKCHQLKVDTAYMVEKGDANLASQVGPHYLDYMLYVGSRCGLDAALPNVNVNHNWTVKLQLSTRLRLWPDKNISALPFHPQGRMMSIGTRLDEQLWLAMAPNTYFEENHPDNSRDRLPVLDALSSSLSPRHNLMLIMFIAHVLESMRVTDRFSFSFSYLICD
ncbi:hypothetical protein SCLCIDRAFT_22605 [Scleroderma citrinum Foug A]|uniref:DUF8190 domain-containing protein n=1 Tax=Scleroderma citrinum Foug A TaxID=1036808 RepID=A0A0C2ZW81_9AGAM|nr:hypothetical protein SCLCIDRAFT_22605 [Scleroderma citrinum Foug A]